MHVLSIVHVHWRSLLLQFAAVVDTAHAVSAVESLIKSACTPSVDRPFASDDECMRSREIELVIDVGLVAAAWLVGKSGS